MLSACRETMSTTPQFGTKEYWQAYSTGEISDDQAQRDAAAAQAAADYRAGRRQTAAAELVEGPMKAEAQAALDGLWRDESVTGDEGASPERTARSRKITGAPRRPGRAPEPVHRFSRRAGHCEGVWWSKTTKQDVRRIVLAARRYELAHRLPGKRSGPLGFVAIEVLELFANLVSFRTGRLDPAIETIMERLRRSRDAVVRALKALRSHGFLDWLRRYQPSGRAGAGPQVIQCSNAYRLYLPKAAASLVGRYFQPAPVPDDIQLAARAFGETLALDELPLWAIHDNDLAQALARLGRAIKSRESVQRDETLSIHLKGK